MSNFEIAMEQIKKERERQNEKWGDEFDNNNTPYNWQGYVARYVGLLSDNAWKKQPEEFKANMIKIGALAVAYLETLERKKQKQVSDENT